jgi:LacI family transcriptional regulator
MKNVDSQSVVSMSDLAKLAGCSTMAVSLALRGSPRVSENKRAEILALAKLHGYRPNPLISALVAQRRSKRPSSGQTLAVLTKFDKPLAEAVTDTPYFTPLLAGMKERAAELGFKLEEFATHVPDAPDPKRLTQILMARGIQGVVLFPGGGLDRSFPDLEWEHFATVAAAHHMRALPVHRTAGNYSHGMEICLAEAERRGYRRVGLAMTCALDPTSGYGFSGRYLAWQHTLPQVNRLPLVSGEGTEVDFEAFSAWVRQYWPDLIITLNTPATDWLRRIGRRVPDDVGVISLSLRGRTDLAGLDQQTHDQGRSTITLLARELFLNQRGLPKSPELVLTEGVWRDGPTLGIHSGTP